MNKKILFSLLCLSVLVLPSISLAIVELDVEFPRIGEESLTGETTLPGTIKYVFNLVIIIAVLVVLLSLLYGGVRYLSSTGDPAKMADGRKRITRSAMGLFILMASYFILLAANPQLLVLKINKQHVEADGVILLSREVFDPSNSDIMTILTSGTEEEIAEIVQELLGAPAGKPKAVYLHNSMSDLSKRFGELLLGPELSSVPNPLLDQRHKHDYPVIDGKDLDHFTFKHFQPYGLYFMPGANAKVITYFKSDFETSWNGLKKVAQFVHVYPNCSKGIGPCPFKLITQGWCANQPVMPAFWRDCSKTVPLSIELKHMGPGVYLHSDNFWEETYLNHKDRVEFLRDRPYQFNNKTKEVEIRNWIEEKVGAASIYVKKTNYLAILHEDEEFKGSLRIFFEKFETPSGAIPSFVPGYWGNIIGNVSPGNAGAMDIISNPSDAWGKVEGVSSAQAFQMPNTDEEWQRWFEGAEDKGCLVTVCAEKGLPLEQNPEACKEFDFNTNFLEPQGINIEGPVEIRIDEDGIPGWDMDPSDPSKYQKKEVPLNDNARSLNIKGDCVVVLFENPPNAQWQGGGVQSEVFVPWGKEFENNNGYKDITNDNTIYPHEIGHCNCSWTHILQRVWGVCDPCASTIAIYPIINN